MGSRLILLQEPEIHHLPDPGTINGALDLVSLCFLVIFGNALDFRTYCSPDGSPVTQADNHDVNNISIDERCNMCVARGTCLELLRWWDSKYAISTTTISYQGNFATHFLLSQAGALWNYKFRAEEDDRLGAPGCTKELLINQITNILNHLGIGDVDRMTQCAVDEKSDGMKFGNLTQLGISQATQKKMTLTCRDPPKEYGNQPDVMTPIEPTNPDGRTKF